MSYEEILKELDEVNLKDKFTSIYETKIMKTNVGNLKVGTITEKNHPYRHAIIGMPKEQLLNRRPYVLSAISAWKENRYNATNDEVAYNINYFEVELKIIDKELDRK